MTTNTKTSTAISGGVPADIGKADFRQAIVSYEISRPEIESCLTDRIVHDLRVDPENPLIQAGPGSVVFFCEGYDDDPREIYEIPEFQKFIRKAHGANPCWMYYAAPESLWLQTVLFCISKTAFVSAARPGHRTLAFSPDEAAGFLDSQLDDCMKLSLIGKGSEKKTKMHLELVFRGFGIELP